MKKLFILLVILAGCNPGQSIEKSGGLRVVMSINSRELVESRAISGWNDDALDDALRLASVRQEASDKNYIDLFVEEYRKIDKETPLAHFFSTYQMRDYITPQSSDLQVISVLKAELETATANSFNVLRSRVDRFGIKSANIQYMEKSGHILLELPGVKEPERVLQLLHSTSNLEFWETYDSTEIIPYLEAINDYLASVTEEEYPLHSRLQMQMPAYGVSAIGYAIEDDIALLNEYFNMPEVKHILPRNLVFKWGAISIDNEKNIFQLYAIKITNRNGEAPLNGEVIVDAIVTKGDYGTPVIDIKMNSEGARLWARLTRENVGRSIAIVIDHCVFSAPMVMDEVVGGRAQISGQFTMKEAKDLVILLKSGRMPCSLNIVKEEIIPPL